jgi:hypothetical protein
VEGQEKHLRIYQDISTSTSFLIKKTWVIHLINNGMNTHKTGSNSVHSNAPPKFNTKENSHNCLIHLTNVTTNSAQGLYSLPFTPTT